MTLRTSRLIVGLTGTGASLVCFFWFCLSHHVFGSRFKASLNSFIFVGWVLLAAFFISFARGGVKGGLKAVIGVGAVMIAALGVGMLLGHYR